MKSEKQTYEAFLRGANQAPSPLASITAPNNQQQQYPPTSSVPMVTSISGGSAKGGGGVRLPSQQKIVQQQPAQQNQQVSPADSMQTVQRLLTQGRMQFLSRYQ